MTDPLAILTDVAASLDGYKINHQADRVREAVAALRAFAAEGWRLVPVEPTEEMQRAYFDSIDRYMARVERDVTFGRYDNHRIAYEKMLAAAPTPQPAPQAAGPLSRLAVAVNAVRVAQHHLQADGTLDRRMLCDLMNEAATALAAKDRP